MRFQPNACIECHDVLMISVDLSNIAILHIHGVDNWISKREAIKKSYLLEYVDINNALVSKKISSGNKNYKYVIG